MTIFVPLKFTNAFVSPPRFAEDLPLTSKYSLLTSLPFTLWNIIVQVL